MKKYNISKIDNETFMITEKIGGVHCYLLIGSDQALLIDTGNGVGNLKKNVMKLTNLPIRVVNTHGHLDHIGGNYQFEQAELPIGEEDCVKQHTDKKYIHHAFKKMLPWFFRLAIMLIVPQMITPHNFKAVYKLKDKDKLNLGKRDIEVISIPGHSMASVCYYDKQRKYIFIGDSVVDNTVLLNLDYSKSLQEYWESLEKVKTKTDEETLFFPGHTTSPLTYEFLDKFIICAKAGFDKDVKLSEGSESGKKCQYLEKEGVRIALRTNS